MSKKEPKFPLGATDESIVSAPAAKGSAPSKKKKKTAEGAEPRQQYAALPWRVGESVEILLVSSRDTGRWVIPKGWPMKRRKPYATAALEAEEEAGVSGKIEKTKIGSFHYYKRLKNGAALLCRVDVFPLQVLRQRKRWREQGQRESQWLPYADAAGEVQENELRQLILAFGQAGPRRGASPKKRASGRELRRALPLGYAPHALAPVGKPAARRGAL